MTTNKSFKRPGYPTVTTGLNLKDPEGFIAWAQKALGAEPGLRFEGPDGKVMHAEVKIGDTIIAVDRATRDPETQNALFHVYVADADAAFKRAVDAGGKQKMPPTDMFFGERMGAIGDPFGNSWGLSTFQREPTMDEMKKGAEEFMKKQAMPR